MLLAIVLSLLWYLLADRYTPYTTQARVEGYVVGGKTGTAQYWDKRIDDWAQDSYNYTFCGFVGGDRPELVIIVRIHEAAPTVKRNRLLIPEIESYEAFRRIAQNAIDVLDLPPIGSGEPEPEEGYTPEEQPVEADAPDGADVFALHAKRNGWLARLRRDLSGIKKVEEVGDRAPIETVHGTRYPFRRRENGIWGLTLFTATLGVYYILHGLSGWIWGRDTKAAVDVANRMPVLAFANGLVRAVVVGIQVGDSAARAGPLHLAGDAREITDELHAQVTLFDDVASRIED